MNDAKVKLPTIYTNEAGTPAYELEGPAKRIGWVEKDLSDLTAIDGAYLATINNIQLSSEEGIRRDESMYQAVLDYLKEDGQDLTGIDTAQGEKPEVVIEPVEEPVHELPEEPAQ